MNRSYLSPYSGLKYDLKNAQAKTRRWVNMWARRWTGERTGEHTGERASTQLWVHVLRHVQAIPHGVLGQSYLTETACLNWMNTRYIYKIRVNYSPGCWNLTLHIVWSHTCWVNMNFSKFISLLFPNWKTWLRSVFCACVYFLRIYSPSFCSFVSIHVLFRSSMFFLQMVSLPGKVFSDHVFAGRWSFQILCFDFGR